MPTSIFAAFALDPGHRITGTMEAPTPSDTVALSAGTHHHHRPGPVFGAGGGVFQPATSGKYSSLSDLSVPDVSSRFSGLDYGCESNLRIYYQNVRGLRTKIDSFFLAVTDEEYDVIVLTETWLDDRVLSVQLFGNRYHVFRNDRSHLSSRKSRGGGVMVAVSVKLNCHIDPAPIYDTLEQLWVIIDTPGNKVSVGVLYLPPDRKSEPLLIQQHIDSIGSVFSRLNSNAQALLFGDYNQSGLRWICSDNSLPQINTLCSQMPASCCDLFDGFNLHGLTQINTVKNRDNRMLDIVFATEAALPNCAVSAALEPLVEPDAVHPALTLLLFLPQIMVYDHSTETQFLNFRRADYAALSALLSEVNWDSFLHPSNSIDDAVNSFSSAINNAIQQVVPVCEPQRKPPWSNARLRTLKRLRAAALRKYCGHRSLYHKNMFSIASRQYRNYNRLLYSNYVKRTQDNLRRNPKQFWSFVNSKRKEIGLPSAMFLSNCPASNEREKCSLFAAQFKRVFSNVVASATQVVEASNAVPRNAISFAMPLINEDTITAGLRKLKTSYSVGPDGIPSSVLKRCSDVLCYPIVKLFNLSVQQGIFPEQWKYSYLFPIHKKGDKRDISNYRGITSLCACSKLFEVIVNDALFASCSNYIDVDQHGFFPRRSVTTNLIQFVSRCVQNLDAGFQTDAIYLDLKAAFDRVDHEILLTKMERLGVSTEAIRWFRSYLIGRTMCVKIGSVVSECFSNKSGVPQGSNLGPLLFSIFVNDVSFLLPPGCRMFYADDTKLFNTIKTHSDCLELQDKLNSFANWSTTNCLTLSIEKCQVISFHRKQRPIEFAYNIANHCLLRVEIVKDLGVLLDRELSFRSHYDCIISKANRQLGFLFKIADEFRNPLCLKSLYCCLVRSILETNSIIWCPFHANWSQRIEKVQKKFVRYALRHLPWRDSQNLPSYEDRCRLLSMQPLQLRREVAQAVFVAKILTAEIDCPSLLAQLNIYAPERPLRQRNFMYLEPRNRLFGSHEPIRAICQRFNEVYEFFDFNTPTSAFRHRLLDVFRTN